MIPLVTNSAFVAFALKAALVLAFAFGVTGLLRRASAASRHVVWLASFVGVLALPVGAMLMPSLSVPMPFWTDHTPAPDAPALAVARDQLAAEVAITGARVAEADRMAHKVVVAGLPEAHLWLAKKEAALSAANGRLRAAAATRVAPPADAPAAAGWPWSTRIFMLWIAGFVMVGVAFAVGVLRTHLVACAALPASDMLSEEAERLAASLGIARPVRVVTWPGPAMPMTWGARRPVVLLPQDAAEWPAARRREVLTHELAHVSRGDWLVRLLAALVCALHWFNPLVWMAARRMRDEQELACDDAVLATGVRPSDYAAHLLEVARGLRTPPGVSHAAVAMARPSQLTGRLLAVLDTSRARISARRSSRLAWLLMFVVALPLAAVVPAAPGVAPDGMPARPLLLKAKVAEPIAALAIVEGASRAPLTAAAARAGADRCPEETRRGSHSHSGSSNSISDDASPQRVTLSIRFGACTIEIKIIGNVRFNDTETDVADVPRNGSMRLTEEGNGPDRRFDMSWRDGRLVRRFWVDDREVAESVELRTWLGEALQATFSRTGFDAIPRAMRAYRAGGLDSTLVLAEATGSDYSRRMMLMALIDSIRIPAADAARIARQAQSMSSDYERAELLIAVATKVGLDGAVQDAMTASAAAMSSDYERRRVLSSALDRPGLSSRSAGALLNTAEIMSSDYEKAELLIGYLRKQALAADRRAAFLAAAGSIESDYEHHRVLSALIEHHDAAASVVPDVAAQAETFHSDYERAELLVQVARRFGSSADARARIRRATETISSDYERDRVLAALGRLQ